jgi:hypothetical protein
MARARSVRSTTGWCVKEMLYIATLPLVTSWSTDHGMCWSVVEQQDFCHQLSDVITQRNEGYQLSLSPHVVALAY